MSFSPPELATLTKKYFSDPDWIYEEKFDGVRCIAIKKNGKVKLYSRNKKSLNRSFPEIVEALEKKKSKDYVVDGEIVAFEEKVTRFSKLQNRLGILDLSRIKGDKARVFYYVFDLIKWDGKDLKSLPLIERKKELKAHFPKGGPVRYTPHVKGKGVESYKKACKMGYEGIIAKRADSKYLGRRTRDWLKFKCTNSQELVIGGFTKPKGSRIHFGALLLGFYEKGKLQYAGKVGTGFDTKLLEALGKKLKSIERESCPFATRPKENNVHFVRPSLVCEIGFTEWTKDHKLRHPRFVGLRKDKPAKSVRK